MRAKDGHIAISSHHQSIERAEEYASALAPWTGRDVVWTVEPYAHPLDPVGREDDRFFNREATERRLEVIRTAAALVVVTGAGLEWSGSLQTGGMLPPTPEQQLDIAAARCADVPVLMPEGFPSFRPQHQHPGVLDTAVRLRAFGVQSLEGDESFQERVSFIARAAFPVEIT